MIHFQVFFVKNISSVSITSGPLCLYCSLSRLRGRHTQGACGLCAGLTPWGLTHRSGPHTRSWTPAAVNTQESAGGRELLETPRSPGERGQPPALSPAPGREARRPGSAASRAACLLCWCFQLSNQGEVPRTEARGSPSPRLMRALGSGGWGGRKPWDLRGKVAKTLDHPGSRGLCAQGCRSTASKPIIFRPLISSTSHAESPEAAVPCFGGRERPGIQCCLRLDELQY